MNRFLTLALALCLLLLCGCNKEVPIGAEVHSNEQYSIMERDGVFYLQFVDGGAASVDNQSGALTPGTGGIAFASVKVMRDRIINGGFSTNQLTSMKGYQKTANGEVAVCNVNALWDVVLPDDLSLEAVLWTGLTYTFNLRGDELEGRLYVTTEEGYKRMLEMVTLVETENTKFTSVSKEPERNATVTTYENKVVGSAGKQIAYTYEENGFAISVFEKYYYDQSESVPFIISVFGEGNGIYYYSQIREFTERPSYEWIKSIGVTPYVETETE